MENDVNNGVTCVHELFPNSNQQGLLSLFRLVTNSIQLQHATPVGYLRGKWTVLSTEPFDYPLSLRIGVALLLTPPLVLWQATSITRTHRE